MSLPNRPIAIVPSNGAHRARAIRIPAATGAALTGAAGLVLLVSAPAAPGAAAMAFRLRPAAQPSLKT